MDTIKRALRVCLPATILAMVAGCSVPPRPQPPELAKTAQLQGIPDRADAAWPDRAWWTRYRDADLDAIETKALATAPSLAVARARFDAALRTVDIARADGGASIDGTASVTRQRLSEHGLIPPKFLGFNWYNQGDLNVRFSYDFDFWGSHGADIAAALDRAQAAAADRAQAEDMLTAAVADSYFGWQADQARLALARDVVAREERIRDISAARVKHGLDDEDIVHQADADLAVAREQVATVEWSAAIHKAAIAALLGVGLPDLPEMHARPLPRAATALPADAGLDLVARRADVEASRLRVEAALRDIDVARAAFYPDISLSALIGLQSIELDKFFLSSNRVPAIGPALHLPIFEGGRLHARFGASEAALQAAIADYNQAVVEAARAAAGEALLLLQAQARRKEHDAQLTAAEHLHASAQARAQHGLADARPELAAAVEIDRQRDVDAQLASAALSAEIALTKALGGGFRADADTDAQTEANTNNTSGGALLQ